MIFSNNTQWKNHHHSITSNHVTKSTTKNGVNVHLIMTRYSVQGSRSPASTMPTLLCTLMWHEICSNSRSRIICRKGEEVSKKTKILCLFNHQPCWVSAYLSFIKKTCLQARRYLDRRKILILTYIKIYFRVFLEFVMMAKWIPLQKII